MLPERSNMLRRSELPLNNATPARLPPLIPPHRYAPVEEGIHRGAYPKARNCRFLKRLKLRTILSLIPDAPHPELMKYCAANSINHITLRVEKPKENVPWTYSKIAQALQICLDPANAPLYIHCLDGANVTGMLVMCLRRLETWATPAAVSEFSRFSGGGHILPEEFTFLEKFSAEIELPAQLPKWLWNGSAVGFGKRHPTFSMKHLKFTNPDHIAERAEMFATGGGNAREERERRERETIRGEIMMGEYRKRVNADLLSDILGDKTKATTSAALGGPPILPTGLPATGGQRNGIVATNTVSGSGSIGHHGSLPISATPEDHAFRDASGILLRDDHSEVYIDTDSEEDADGKVGTMGMSMTLQALALEGYTTASGKDWD